MQYIPPDPLVQIYLTNLNPHKEPSFLAKFFKPTLPLPTSKLAVKDTLSKTLYAALDFIASQQNEQIEKIDVEKLTNIIQERLSGVKSEVRVTVACELVNSLPAFLSNRKCSHSNYSISYKNGIYLEKKIYKTIKPVQGIVKKDGYSE